MKVFISWSGERSRKVAEALQQWLPRVIQATEPWISTEISKGSRWGPEISSRLEESRIGIICLTPENLTAPWLLFEAGALSKTKDAYVCTFLLDVVAADVEQPLGQFQHTLATKEDVRRFLATVNKAVRASGERALSESDLDEVFLTFWPRLEEKSEISAAGRSEHGELRTDRELLEEVLEIVRGLDRRSPPPPLGPVRKDALVKALREQLLATQYVVSSPEPGPAFRALSEAQAASIADALEKRRVERDSSESVAESREQDRDSSED